MRTTNRKATPRVVKGKVQKKNNWQRSTNYYTTPLPGMVAIDRKRPGEGYKHVLNKSDIYRFLELLPDWNTLAVGLNAVVLAPGRDRWDGGYFNLGVVCLYAWEAGLWCERNEEYVQDHRAIFDRLGVECEPIEGNYYLCKFDEASVRGYQLLHILLHELGHHHDRMTTRSQRSAERGEPYAEAYALQYEELIWDSYTRAFR
jgi:hypothetical protein